MKKDIIKKLHARFEDCAYEEEGLEFWLARDLQELLGYSEWRNFLNVVEKAKKACRGAGQSVDDHFVDVNKMIELAKGAKREIEDISLTRYACYLIAQNGDTSKRVIAFAQTYFALQTRKQEIIEARLEEIERLEARQKLKLSERELSGIIFERLGDGNDFARIRSKGDQALFGGVNTQRMKDRLSVPKGRSLADFLPTITIKAKDFANEITNFNIKRDNLSTEPSISSEHITNNKSVRKALTDRGITPEKLPPSEDAQKVRRRLDSQEKKLLKVSKKRSSTE